MCADKITVSFDDLSFTEDYFSTIQNTGNNTDYIKEHIAMNYVMRPIQELLDGKGEDNGGYKVTANEEHSNTNNFYIKPCVDDRMFVCCLVRDDDYSDKIKKFNKNKGEYNYLSECYDREEKGLDIDLYKLLYVEKDASCQSATMRHELLKRSVYDRWIDWGTIHGVTHHSLICLTSAYEGIINSVINPFLTQYVQIAVLTVVQRAVILLLSDEAAEVANGFAGEDEITQEEIKSIERLQARYVTAQNQLLLSEVTAQEQGVEIYEMLQEQLYIKKNMDDLHSEIGNLRDVADIANSRLERANDEQRLINDRKLMEMQNKQKEIQEQLEKEEEKRINSFSIWISILFIIEPFALMITSKEDRNQGILWFFLTLIALVVLYKLNIGGKNGKKNRNKK